ncbi:hypothetical protein Gilli_0163 [Gillisia limnaea DSM 15749]|uniref:Uncharacterized protein n=1 Tax=Gillisia limnaea (strain DSM 15749 / LMG 21470 / R-8282) TaxID=865937 RepID=H2BR02_GILLR|nr:hypothetical protein Gilli_0163 [Gillisia limnaea DSM 15749]
MDKPKKYIWKKSYTIVLLANAFYILLFFLIMKIFS